MYILTHLRAVLRRDLAVSRGALTVALTMRCHAPRFTIPNYHIQSTITRALYRNIEREAGSWGKSPILWRKPYLKGEIQLDVTGQVPCLPSRPSDNDGHHSGRYLYKINCVILFSPDGSWWRSGNTHIFQLKRV